MFRKSKSLILAAALLAGTSLGAMAGTVTPLMNFLPFDSIVYGFLLTMGNYPPPCGAEQSLNPWRHGSQ